MATTAPPPGEVSGARVGRRLAECGDEALAQLVADADEAAFAVLYERHYQSLYRYCRSIVRDDLDAQDAIQSAWTGALVALRRGRRDAPVRPWLYRIVHNEAISVLRRRRSELPAQGQPPGAASAEDHAIDRERFELLLADLRQLPERPRGALLMRELNGLSHEEIAVALQTSVAAAKQCVYEARRHLADLAAGRQTPCDEICRSISDGDRRVLRGRRVMAHLRHCPGCAAFASAIDQRRGALHALTPWLAAPAAISVLDRVLRAGSAPVTSAGAGAAGGSAGGAGGFAGSAGSSAVSQSAIAGGTLSKALGTSLLAKTVVAAAAVTAGVLSLGSQGAAPRIGSPRSPHSSASAAAVASGPRSAPSPRAGAFSAGRPGRGVAARPKSRAVRRPQAGTAPGPRAPERANKASGAQASGRAKTRAGDLSPGQGHKASAGLPPGQARKIPGALPPGQARKGSSALPPGQAKKGSVSRAPGHAKKKASAAIPPGQVKKASGSLAQGRANKVAGAPTPGQAKKASGSVAPQGPDSPASGAAAPGQSAKPPDAMAPGRADKTSSGAAAADSGAAPADSGAAPSHASSK